MSACAICGDAIGVYEPLVAITAGKPRRTSLAREPDLDTGAQTILHLSCADGAGLIGDAATE